MSSLAILILTHNEEENIVPVVENAKKCTDEVIIIDSGSTDQTVALAKEHGAKVSFRAWTDDFSAQRNFALEQTSADWVLYLDADERLNDALIAEVKHIVASGKMDAQYAITRKSVAFGVTFSYGVLYPDHVLRMFPREASHGSTKSMNAPSVSFLQSACPAISNTILMRTGMSGKRSSVSIQPSGQKMPTRGVNGYPWRVFSCTA